MSIPVYLFDTVESHENLLPLSFTRPVADFRVGILTIKEKWEKRLEQDCFYLPVEYLRGHFGSIKERDLKKLSIFIAGNILPDGELCDLIKNLNEGEALIFRDELVAFKGYPEDFYERRFRENKTIEGIRVLKYVFDIFLYNPEEIEKDYDIVTKGRISQELPDCTRLIGQLFDDKGKRLLFIEEGAQIECVTINLRQGPVYIGKDAILMEGSCIRGPLAIGEESEIRMGARIYSGTTIGPHCKIGGEIDNTVIFGYSNKAHDGYLGNAVIGEWCNIGAGVNASNLKNDYSKIRVWNYKAKTFMHTDLQFCGLIMGDHSKIGVNCMLNTATVIGVGVNLHGGGFPRVFLPSFREGSPSAGFSEVGRKKFQAVAERAMKRRNIEMSATERELYDILYYGEWPQDKNH